MNPSNPAAVKDRTENGAACEAAAPPPKVHGFVEKQYGQYVEDGGDGLDVLQTRSVKVGYDNDFLRDTCGMEDTNLQALFQASCGSGCPLRLLQQAEDEERKDDTSNQVAPPLSLVLKPGSAVLDLGCGAGHDVVLASRLVGAQGRVVGLDLTPAMIEAATANVERFGDAKSRDNVSFVLAPMDLSIDQSTLPANTFDVCMSNGAINLCHDKRAAFRTAFHALKPGGTLVVSDACRVAKNPTAPISCSIGDSYTN